jgi:hypothetical protein
MFLESGLANGLLVAAPNLRLLFLRLNQRKATIPAKDRTSGRKQGGADKAASKPGHAASNTVTVANPVAPVAALSYSNGITVMQEPPIGAPGNASTQQAIAKSAVGRGIRHSLGYDSSASASAAVVRAAQSQTTIQASKTAFYIPAGVEDSLSQLASNYHNSLAAETPHSEQTSSLNQSQPQSYQFPARDQDTETIYSDPFSSLLSRNSSLLDLAMIPNLEGEDGDMMPMITGMGFVDFPQPEVDPSNVSAYRSNLERTEASGT